jgi:hypothetical protein
LSGIFFDDKISIINYGVSTQHLLKDLNAVVANIAHNKDYSEITDLYNILMELLSEGEKAPSYADTMIQSIEAGLLNLYIELVKDCALYRELRNTNNAYLEILDSKIREAEDFLNKSKENKTAEYDAIGVYQLENRIGELKTSRTVGLSLNEQLNLYESNSSSFAERIQAITQNLLPLFKSSNSLEQNKNNTGEALKLLESMASELAKARDLTI